jgi:uncharacterized protein
MTWRGLAVIDTNVVVSGLITAERGSPSARILDGMLTGRLRFVVSVELLAEYRAVLLRPRICSFHRLPESDVDRVIRRLAESGALRHPDLAMPPAPDPGDQHLWDLLGCVPGSLLITGDRALLDAPPAGHSVVSPRNFVSGW